MTDLYCSSCHYEHGLTETVPPKWKNGDIVKCSKCGREVIAYRGLK